jgi:hypothetical protein
MNFEVIADGVEVAMQDLSVGQRGTALSEEDMGKVLHIEDTEPAAGIGSVLEKVVADAGAVEATGCWTEGELRSERQEVVVARGNHEVGMALVIA